MTRIERFGYRGDAREGVARVVSQHGDYYHLVCNETEGEVIARKKKSVFREQGARSKEQVRREILVPITGDFVKFRYNAQGESMITEVLPRFSSFERKDPTARRKAQTLAVNFDILFIMMSLNENYSSARLERFLDLAKDMGEAEPVVVLTKSDLLERVETADGEDPWQAIQQELAPLVGPDVPGGPHPVIRLSIVTGEGLPAIRALVAPGRTVAFIGSSGVGKSSLVNALAGEDWMPTQEIQAWSGKGRHTTTSRELVMLPNGAMVVDTPGIREIGRVGEDEALVAKGTFSHRWRAK